MFDNIPEIQASGALPYAVARNLELYRCVAEEFSDEEIEKIIEDNQIDEL